MTKPLALAATAGATLLVALVPTGASAAILCPPTGTKVVKSGGQGVVYTQRKKHEGRVYSACSKRYGKAVRLTADASALVDESFEVKTLKVTTTAAKLVYCSQTDEDYTRYTVTANLKTGAKAKFKSEDIADGSC